MSTHREHHPEDSHSAGKASVSSTRGSIGRSRATRRRNRIRSVAIAAVVLVIVVAGVAIYLDRIAPFRATVISVDDARVSMRTFLRRIRIAGADPMVMLDVLTDEEIIKQVAPFPPYSIEVTESDIDGYLRSVAAESDISGDEFEAWYRNQVNESLMSEDEFREFVRARVLKIRLREYLAERVPTVAEQVHLYMASFRGLEAAREAKARIEGGEEFQDVVADASADASARANGGDIGWHARNGLSRQIGRLAFDRLAVGEVSEPYFLEEDIFALVMVADRVAVRRLDEAARSRMQERALENWLDEEEENHEIEYHGFSGAYDAATHAWVRWQLDKM